jgi:uncharacterized SAM-binding protein YcdF (DUF218 family)
MIYLHKILPLLISPLFLVIFLLVLGLLLRSYRICFGAIVLLLTCSFPIFSNKLILYLEREYKLTGPANVEKADAIVVLSGMLRTIETNDGFRYEFGEASDRIFAGIELFEEKKSPIIVLTRGKLPWSVGVFEGEYLRDLAIKMGIPENSILLTEPVLNTDQEAKSIKKIVSGSDHSIILVTSAFHMSRAKKVFEATGIKVIPFPVDFLSSSHNSTIMDFIPSASGFNNTSFFVREMIGRAYYSIKY